ncbi:MAG: ASCH domain-containing protein [Bacteroidia bacterium]
MLLGFKREFAVPIKKGTKVFTMRFPRKRPAKIGETLHMYSDLRTKKTRLISKKFTLISVQKVHLKLYAYNQKGYGIRIEVDGVILTSTKLFEFMNKDGFHSVDEFMNYWMDGKEEVSYNLDLYHWTDLRF